MHVSCHRLSGCAAALLLLGCCTVASGNSLGDLRGLKTKESRFPIYNKDRLQLMIYSAETERNGNLIATTEPIMDIIRRDADVDDIAATGKTVLYPLNAPLKDVLSFWVKRLYSEGVINSKHADIDQENKIAGGSEEVYFRSPLIDLNGVGFEANYDKRTVLVKKDVHIVVRLNASDPREIVKLGKLPEKYEFLTANSNSMFLDFVKNEIRLIGNVKVREPRADISCDVLTIYLDKDKKGKSSSGDDLAGGISGVSRIVCEGNVVISRHDEGGKKEEDAPVQRGSADRIVYELGEGLITLTGLPGKQPILEHAGSMLAGNEIVIHRNEERMQLRRDCRMLFAQADSRGGAPTTLTSDNMDLDYRRNQGLFTGNVKVADETTQMDCPRMKVTLLEIPGSVASAAQPVTPTASLMPGLATGNRRELDQITCLDSVTVVHKEKTAKPSDPKVTTKVTARGSTYDYRNNMLHFEGDVKVRDPRMELDCDKLSLVFDRRSGNSSTLAAAGDMLRGGKSELSRIITTGNVKIRNFANPAAANLKQAASILTAKNGFVDLKNNVTEFDGDVKLRDPRMKLDCDKLKIFTADSAKADAGRADMGQLLAAPGSNGKSVERIECIGNVRAFDARGKLASDDLKLYFSKVKEGTVPTALRSGDTELVKVTCDGNVKIENIPQPATQTAKKQEDADSSTQLSGMFKRGTSQPMTLTADRGIVDLKTNLSEFHGNVNVKEEQTSLACRSLYLQARPTSAAIIAARKAPPKPSAEEEIDRDPLAASAESDVPSQLNIGEGRELTEVIADKDVVINRVEAGKTKPQTAIGDRAHYVVSDRKITLTGTPEERPILRDPQQGEMRGRKVIVDLAHERMFVEEDTQLDLSGDLSKIDMKNLK